MANYLTARLQDYSTGEEVGGTISVDEQNVTIGLSFEPVVANYIDNLAIPYINAKFQDLNSTIQSMINARLEQERKKIFALIEEHTSINLTQSEFLDLLK